MVIKFYWLYWSSYNLVRYNKEIDLWKGYQYKVIIFMKNNKNQYVPRNGVDKMLEWQLPLNRLFL